MSPKTVKKIAKKLSETFINIEEIGEENDCLLITFIDHLSILNGISEPIPAEEYADEFHKKINDYLVSRTASTYFEQVH